MTQPHHHVINALQQAIIRGVKIDAILPHLIEKEVIPEANVQLYQSQQPKSNNGMKILISYLRNQSYETFLGFTECIFLAQRDAPSKVQSTVVDSMIIAVQDFDRQNSTTHAQSIVDIQQKYMKKIAEETDPGVEQPLVEDISSPSEEVLSGGKWC